MGVMTTIGLPGFGSDFCHFTTAGYRVMGEWMFRLVARDIYGKTYPYDVTPANVKKIFFTTDQKNEIAILLRNNQHVIWRPDSFLYGTTNYTKDYFYLDGKSGAVTDGRSNKDTLFLTLSASSSAKTLTYLPDLFCNGSTTSTYIGPFLYGQNGVAMLSFDKVPISCINNDFPLLKNKTVNVNKYTAVGTTIDTLKATDPDGNTIYYSIVSGDPDHVFSLDSATGILKLVKNLKYYTYALVIRARDNGTCNLEASASYNVITFTTALGENNQSIEIYPNPATDLLNIRSGSSSVSATAVITDITGKILLSETLVSDVESIDVSGLESGLYLVRVSSQKETSTISFLKK